MARVHAALLGCLFFALAPGALAARLEIPLRVPLELVREALAKQLATEWREGNCRYLSLGAPTLEAAEGGRLRLIAPGKGMFGAEVLGKCASAADWIGTARFILAPRIDNAGVLRVRIIDSVLVDARGAQLSGQAPALIWELAKGQIQPRIERFSYDLGASRSALLAILRGAAPPQQAAAMEAALQGLQVLELRVEKTHIVVPVAMEIPDAWLTAPIAAAASAAPLTEAEIEALEQALEPVDAFLVYAIRQIAADSADGALRQRLFTLLLDSRYELSGILSGDARTGGDPVRTLFLDTWNDLRGILAGAQRDGTLDPSLLRYALFIDSGDALLALEQAAPSLGLQLSADGLRQLARSLRPAETGDPLTYDWSVDPQLLELFRVAPLPEKASSLSFFIKVAATEEQPLDHWVPSRGELPAYRARIDALLAKTAAAELQRKPLAAPYDRMFASLVPTTALIESCWRQYVVRGGKVTYLRSQSRSVGIMQVNQHVWRGFYNPERLRWDTAYNMRAGAQILLRYVNDYAVPYAEKSGQPGDVPRAAYAVYNAGPRAVGRFAKNPPHPREARVDEKLWSLYRSVASGGQPDLESCGVRNPG